MSIHAYFNNIYPILIETSAHSSFRLFAIFSLYHDKYSLAKNRDYWCSDGIYIYDLAYVKKFVSIGISLQYIFCSRQQRRKKFIHAKLSRKFTRGTCERWYNIVKGWLLTDCMSWNSRQFGIRISKIETAVIWRHTWNLKKNILLKII